MIYIMLSLLVGIIIGAFFPPRAWGAKLVNGLTTVGLFLILVAMGAQLGANENVLTNLDQLGMRAVLMASFAVAGSVLMVYGVFRWLEFGKGQTMEDEQQ